MSTQLYLIRGLPGSGKSTLAHDLKRAGLVDEVVEADIFFMEDGVYRFDPKKLPAAHNRCIQTVQTALGLGRRVAVANTFSQHWEMERYLRVVQPWKRVTALDLYDAGQSDVALAARCIHGVPVSAIATQRARWEPGYTPLVQL
jgi:predicted kinase